MDGFDAALARYRAFLASEPIAPLLRRSLALLVPDNIRIDTVTPDDSLRCTTDGTSVTVGGAAYLLRADFDALFPQCANVTPQYSGQRSLALRGVQCVFRLFSPLL